MTTTYEHIPVMRDRVIELLAPALEADDALLVDGTLGLGGHTEAFLETFPSLRVLGIDRDREAIDQASVRLGRFGNRFVPSTAVMTSSGKRWILSEKGLMFRASC